MLLLGILLNIFIRGVVPSLSPLPLGFVDCVEAERGCKEDPRCKELYMTLEYCASEEALAPLGNKASIECLEALSGLHYLPLLACKCQRGARREEHCLKVYWSIRILQASSLLLDGQNVCLKAAQDCGLYEKCGSLRSEYVLACTKHAPGSDHCNRQKCHRALRRFLERVPEEYSLGLLFCPCTDKLCGERRRKTIVPSCSYQERDWIQPNCLLLQSFCRRDHLCRSRLADFQYNCQPSGKFPSGCIRETGAVCLKSYAGLIGTIMTPNYVSNSTVDVDLWCNCEGSGNQWQDCLRIQHMFTNNACLENSIGTMGSSSPRPVESTFPPPSRPSPLDQQNELSNNAQDELSNNAVQQSEEEEDMEEEEEGGQFDVIPLYAEKATVSNLGSGGGEVSPRLSIGPPPSLLLLLLLLSASLSWGPPGFDVCLFFGLHSCLPCLTLSLLP
ncbi:GDNF family receptor alpha-4 isoform X2 [Oncorhynchus mykiss]|uniref:GDNF family receptor alpha-4 isoform X2 n=1 Tax=Oncorhynchus mykiss TaxID=8022 RepID=UPI001877DD08|nr:GDNF family receptor alpha-4 isoform X2 [Oncorhynchus mykiss]